MGRVLLAMLLLGCSEDEAPPETNEDPGPPESQCGEVFDGEDGYDVTIDGAVSIGGAPAEGVAVDLVEMNWERGRVFGSGLSDAGGLFTIDGINLTVVEDCWGTAIDYKIMASLDPLEAERDVNSQLFNAINDGSLATDISGIPIELE
jgi:hypothetical protein